MKQNAHGSERIATRARASRHKISWLGHVRAQIQNLGRRFVGQVERFNTWRDRKFEKMQDGYERVLHIFIDQKSVLFIAFAIIFAISLTLPIFVIGEDFFPQTDAGILKMHVRARSGMRIEDTEHEITRVEKLIRSVIPPTELQTISSMIGVPMGYTLAFVATDSMGPMDAEIQVQLNEKHRPTLSYTRQIREKFANEFPGSTLYFQPADLIDMVLNFGQSAMIDVQIESKKTADGIAVAKHLLEGVKSVPGMVDAHLAQVFDYPTLKIEVDRVRAAKMGLTQKNVAASMLISLSSSSLYAPSFYLNPENNVNYFVVAKVPLSRINSVEDLERTPITSASVGSTGAGSAKFSSTLDSPASDSNGAASQAVGTRADVASSGIQEAPSQLLGSLAEVSTGVSFAEVDHHNVQRVVDITGGVEGRDLGSVVDGIQAQIMKLGALPQGVTARVLGQSETMKAAFGRLALGMVIAVAFVYLLMVVLFQSWIDPLIILLTLPGALTGILWMLTLTGTSLNVVSLMGAVMAIGIAVSNSILLVSFANDLRHGTGSNQDSDNADDIGALQAAVIAGKTRLRPVIMTALAMILGMLPMSLGLGAGGEQNAPLGRAVIGGLFLATLTTLFVVPVVYSVLRRARPQKFIIRRQVQACEMIFDQETGDPSPQPAR